MIHEKPEPNEPEIIAANTQRLEFACEIVVLKDQAKILIK